MGFLPRRLAARDLILLLLVPAIAASAAVALTTRQPLGHEGSMSLVLTPVRGAQWDGSAGETADAFLGVMRDEAYRQAVAAEAPASIDDVTRRLRGSALGFDEAVRVTYVDEARADVRPTLAVAASTAVDRLYGPELRDARAALDAAQEEYDAVTTRIEQVRAEAGELLPYEAYRSGVRRLEDLQRRLSAAGVEGRAGTAEGYRAEIAGLEGELATLAPHADEYARLENRQRELERSVANAAADLRSAEAKPAAVDVDGAVEGAMVTRLGRLERASQAAVLGGGAGLLVALAGVALLHVTTGRAATGARDADRPERPRAPSSTTAAGGDAADGGTGGASAATESSSVPGDVGERHRIDA